MGTKLICKNSSSDFKFYAFMSTKEKNLVKKTCIKNLLQVPECFDISTFYFFIYFKHADIPSR